VSSVWDTIEKIVQLKIRAMIDNNKDSCRWRDKQSRYISNRLSSGRGRRGESSDGRVECDSNECKQFSFDENLR